MTRVHYKGSSTFCCSSDAPCEEMRKSIAADPAQSAPSSEQLAMKKNLAERDAENFIYDRLGFAFKAINSSLTVTVFKPVKVMSLSQSDHKWDVVYLMDKAWDLLVELAAEKQAAALRTAQLERERDVNKEAAIAYCFDAGRATRATIDAIARAETAESALAGAKLLVMDVAKAEREMREKTIQECIAICDEERVDYGATGEESDAAYNEALSCVQNQFRALLTVAAQTPEENNG